MNSFRASLELGVSVLVLALCRERLLRPCRRLGGVLGPRLRVHFNMFG